MQPSSSSYIGQVATSHTVVFVFVKHLRCAVTYSFHTKKGSPTLLCSAAFPLLQFQRKSWKLKETMQKSGVLQTTNESSFTY